VAGLPRKTSFRQAAGYLELQNALRTGTQLVW
jgi:hypothetical protein